MWRKERPHLIGTSCPREAYPSSLPTNQIIMRHQPKRRFVEKVLFLGVQPGCQITVYEDKVSLCTLHYHALADVDVLY